jgi:hypothetical protein
MDIAESRRLGRGLDLSAGRLGGVFAVGAIVDHQLEALGRRCGEIVDRDLGGDGELVCDASEISHVSYRRLGGGPFVDIIRGR